MKLVLGAIVMAAGAALVSPVVSKKHKPHAAASYDAAVGFGSYKIVEVKEGGKICKIYTFPTKKDPVKVCPK